MIIPILENKKLITLRDIIKVASPNKNDYKFNEEVNNNNNNKNNNDYDDRIATNYTEILNAINNKLKDK